MYICICKYIYMSICAWIIHESLYHFYINVFNDWSISPWNAARPASGASNVHLLRWNPQEFCDATAGLSHRTNGVSLPNTELCADAQKQSIMSMTVTQNSRKFVTYYHLIISSKHLWLKIHPFASKSCQWNCAHCHEMNETCRSWAVSGLIQVQICTVLVLQAHNLTWIASTTFKPEENQTTRLEIGSPNLFTLNQPMPLIFVRVNFSTENIHSQWPVNLPW